jgi:potassium-dependent mechanosensitive channel
LHIDSATPRLTKIAATPAPAVFFIGFGAFSLDFEIAVSIGDASRAGQILSDLHFMIYREFTKHDIEIPIPQQDLHLRTASPNPLEELLAAQAAESTKNGHTQPIMQITESETTDERQPVRDREQDNAVAAKADKQLSPDRVKAPAEKPKLPG